MQKLTQSGTELNVSLQAVKLFGENVEINLCEPNEP